MTNVLSRYVFFFTGNVLVHCVVGISRSATLIIAFLMIKKGISAEDALRFVFQRRRVFPNVGFLHHLAQLENKLRIKNHSLFNKIR